MINPPIPITFHEIPGEVTSIWIKGFGFQYLPVAIIFIITEEPYRVKIPALFFCTAPNVPAAYHWYADAAIPAVLANVDELSGRIRRSYRETGDDIHRKSGLIS